MEIKDMFLHKSPCERSFRHRIHGLLQPTASWCQRETALTSFTVSDAYRQFAAQA